MSQIPEDGKTGRSFTEILTFLLNPISNLRPPSTTRSYPSRKLEIAKAASVHP